MADELKMDVREKLIELIAKAKYICTNDYSDHTEDEYIADTLLDNGVTVQEWIPVKDRLPEVGGYVVCIAKRNPFSRFMPMVARIGKHGWIDPMTEQYISEVTHWMPMPELPEGE